MSTPVTPPETPATDTIGVDAKADTPEGRDNHKDNGDGTNKEDPQEFQELQTKSEALGAQARLNAQCWLMEQMTYLRRYHKPNYTSILSVEGSPEELKIKLLGKAGLSGFMDLYPYQMAALVPYVDLYLVQGSRKMSQLSGTAEGQQKQVLFQAFYPEKTIEALNSGSRARSTATGLKEFYYELDGGQPGGNTQEVKATATAKLKFIAESLSALDYKEGNYASVMDMAMSPSDMIPIPGAGNAKQPNPSSYIVRIVWGWSIPAGSHSMFTKSQRESIDYAAQQMILYQNDSPKLTMAEDGSVELEINYYAKVEMKDKARNKNIDIFKTNVSKAQEKQSAQTDANKQKLNALLAQVKGTVNLEKFGEKFKVQGEWNADNQALLDVLFDSSDGYATWQTVEYDKHSSSADSDEGKDDGTLGVDIKNKGGNEYLASINSSTPDHRHFTNTGEFQKFAQKLNNAYSESKASAQQFEETMGGSRLQKWSRSLGDLIGGGKMHTILVEKEKLGLNVDYSGKNTYDVVARPRMPQILTEEQTKKMEKDQPEAYKAWLKKRNEWLEKNSVSEANYLKIQREAAKNYSNSHGGSIEAVTAHQAYIAAKLADKANSTDASKDALETAKHSTGYLAIDKSGLYARLHFFFFGDLVDAVLLRSNLNGGVHRSPTEPMFMLGTLLYDDLFRMGVKRRIPLAEIPISLEMYTAWMRKYVIGAVKDSMSLKQWIDQILKYLVIPAFGGGPAGCAGEPAKPSADNAGVTYEGFFAEADADGSCRIRKAAGANSSKISVSALPAKLQNPKPDSRHKIANTAQHRYILIHTVSQTTDSLTGTSRNVDAEAGIYWLGLGYETGPTKSTTFSRIESEGFRTTYGQDASRTYSKHGIDGHMEVPQQVEVSMVGNSLFQLGQPFYVDVQSVGAYKDFAMAQALGFGGYYTAINVHGTINEQGWDLAVTGYPKASVKNRQTHREAWLEGRGKLFTETEPMRKKREALEAQAVADHNESKDAGNAASDTAAKAVKAANLVADTKVVSPAAETGGDVQMF